MGAICPHCNRQTTAILPGRYTCDLEQGGCGKTFIVGGTTARRGIRGLHQMNPKYRFVGGRVGPPMGGGIGSASKQSNGEYYKYKSNFTAPDPERQRSKQHLQETLREKLGFWQGEIQQALNEFGEMGIGASLLGLAKEMGIELEADDEKDR